MYSLENTARGVGIECIDICSIYLYVMHVCVYVYV